MQWTTAHFKIKSFILRSVFVFERVALNCWTLPKFFACEFSCMLRTKHMVCLVNNSFKKFLKLLRWNRKKRNLKENPSAPNYTFATKIKLKLQTHASTFSLWHLSCEIKILTLQAHRAFCVCHKCINLVAGSIFFVHFSSSEKYNVEKFVRLCNHSI